MKSSTRSALVPSAGENWLLRDRFILKDPNKQWFHMVWTAWQGVTVGYARSRDLLNWQRPGVRQLWRSTNGS